MNVSYGCGIFWPLHARFSGLFCLSLMCEHPYFIYRCSRLDAMHYSILEMSRHRCIDASKMRKTILAPPAHTAKKIRLAAFRSRAHFRVRTRLWVVLVCPNPIFLSGILCLNQKLRPEKSIFLPSGLAWGGVLKVGRGLAESWPKAWPKAGRRWHVVGV
jgi:hypothetical protein